MLTNYLTLRQHGWDETLKSNAGLIVEVPTADWNTANRTACVWTDREPIYTQLRKWREDAVRALFTWFWHNMQYCDTQTILASVPLCDESPARRAAHFNAASAFHSLSLTSTSQFWFCCFVVLFLVEIKTNRNSSKIFCTVQVWTHRTSAFSVNLSELHMKCFEVVLINH